MPSVDFTVVIAGLPGEGPNAVEICRGSTVGNVSCSLKSIVCRDNSQALHRLRLLSLARGHVEEWRVEEAGFVDEATIRRVAGIDALSGGVVVVGVNVESVGRDLSMDIETLFQELPNFSMSVAPPGIRHSIPTIAILDCRAPRGEIERIEVSVAHEIRSVVAASA